MRIRPPYSYSPGRRSGVGGLHPLQSAGGGLLESWRLSRFVSILLFSPTASHRPPDRARQRQIGTKADVAELTTSFSLLLNMLRGPLQGAGACPPALRRRMESLAGSVDSCHLHILAGRD